MLRIVAFCAMLALGGLPLHAEVIDVDGAGLERLRADGVPVIDVRRADEWRETGVIEDSHLLTFYDKQGRYDLERWLPALARDRGVGPAGRVHLPQRQAQRQGRLLTIAQKRAYSLIETAWRGGWSIGVAPICNAERGRACGEGRRDRGGARSAVQVRLRDPAACQLMSRSSISSILPSRSRLRMSFQSSPSRAGRTRTTLLSLRNSRWAASSPPGVAS